MLKTTILFGITSAVGRAIANNLAQDGHHLLLIGRDAEETARLAADLEIRYKTEIHFASLDLLSENPAGQLMQILRSVPANAQIDNCYFLAGYLGDAGSARINAAEQNKIMTINFTAAVQVLEVIAARMEQEHSGTIIIVGSVAGDRGRQSNYHYGSAKAGLHAFAQGLRNRLYHSGVHVLTVKPGFIDTSMTWGLPGLALVVSPEYVAQKIISAARKKKNTIYVPFFWRYILWLVRMIPEPVFKRLHL